MMLKAGADPNDSDTGDEDGAFVPIHHVAFEGNLELLQVLVEYGVHISYFDSTLWEYAVAGRNPDLLEYCLEHVHQRLGDAVQWMKTCWHFAWAYIQIKEQNRMMKDVLLCC